MEPGPGGHRGNTASASAGHRAPTHAEAMVSTLSAATPVAPTPDTPTPATRERPRRWPVIGVTVLLAATAALYLIDLTSSGDANSFYAAAVKSGTESVTAWIFGSLDAGNAITVDKPPGALWLMVLSARLFGFSSFSLLLPQALLGVGTVALTWATVRRWAGDAAGLVAGTVVMLTPVAALIFRFNNPDALLVFLMTLAAYAVVRAVDAGRGLAARSPHSALAWMVVAGAAIGFGFLTKMAEAFLVLPALGLVYLVVSPLRLRSRLLHLVAALVSMIISAGWFVALVAIWPAAARPYIGGSENNSLWELALGYNGLGRLLGGSGNGGGGGAGGGMGGANTGFGGEAGLLRMVNSAFGGEISWFLPAALLGLVAAAGDHLAGTAGGHPAGLGPALGWLAGRRGRCLLLHGRDDPPLLRRRPRPGDRWPGRHRRGRALASATDPARAVGAGDHDRRHRGLGQLPDGPGRRRLAELGPLGDARGRCRGRSAAGALHRAPEEAGGGRGADRCRRRLGRGGGLDGGHRSQRAHRIHPDLRTGRGRLPGRRAPAGPAARHPAARASADGMPTGQPAAVARPAAPAPPWSTC